MVLGHRCQCWCCCIAAGWWRCVDDADKLPDGYCWKRVNGQRLNNGFMKNAGQGTDKCQLKHENPTTNPPAQRSQRASAWSWLCVLVDHVDCYPFGNAR